MSLSQAKEVIEKAPCTLAEGLSKADAEAMQKAFAESGVKVTLK